MNETFGHERNFCERCGKRLGKNAWDVHTCSPPEAEKQEPVAWRNAALRIGEDLCSVGPFGYYDMTAEQWLEWALSVVTVHAPPPQRKPLTDEQRMEMWRTTKFRGNGGQLDWFIEGTRAAEAAHDIKGEA